MASSSKSHAKLQERKARAREKEYRRKLKLLEKSGIYQPTDESSLTRYRRTRINSAYNEWRQFIDNPREPFFFIDAAAQLDKRDLKEFLGNAKSLSMKVTKRGVFLQKEGQRRAKIVKDKKRNEFDIVLSGKVKWGENQGKKISQRIPVAPLDHLQDEEKRLRLMAESMGPLHGDQAISFIVEEDGEEIGAHRYTYDTPEGVMRKLNEYHVDNAAARLAFFRLVRIQKTTRVQWPKQHPQPAKRTAQRGRALYDVIEDNSRIVYSSFRRSEAASFMRRRQLAFPDRAYYIRAR